MAVVEAGDLSNDLIIGELVAARPLQGVLLLERRSKNSLALLKRDTRLADLVRPMGLTFRPVDEPDI